MFKVKGVTSESLPPRVYLVRDLKTAGSFQGYYGSLVFPFADVELSTIELPWRGNQRSISCIPAGTYQLKPWNSKKFGQCWHVDGVKDRTAILIHKGNFAGAIDQGFKTHSQGCIIIGKSRGVLSGQWAVLNSGAAMSIMNQVLDRSKTYTLIVTEKA